MSGGGFQRAGYSLAEATVALFLAGALIVCLASILQAVGRLATAHERVSAAAETERTVAAVLGAELRIQTANDAAFDADSVRLRAFRAGGTVCTADDSGITLAYRGLRMPEPDKDSVLLVGAGAEAVADVASFSVAADCHRDGGIGLRLATAGPPADLVRPVYALLFETGAYSISASALRYRRGAGGRQPVTATNLSTRGSALAHRASDGAAAAAVVTMRPAGSPDAGRTTWSVHMPQGGARPPDPER